MEGQETSYAIPLIVAGAISAISAIYILWQRRRLLGARTAALMVMMGAEWLLAYALELTSAELPNKLFWNKMQYVGIVMIAPAWLAFTFEYIDLRRWLTRRMLALLSIVPFIILLMVFTNEHHGLIWRSVTLVSNGLFLTLGYTYGAWFWVQLAYVSISVLLGSFLLTKTHIRSYHLYCWQVSALPLVSLATVLGSTLHLFRVNPLWHISLAAFIIPVSGLTLAWGISRLQGEGIVPIARGAVIESMSDGVVVLDARNHIVDLNPVVQRLIGRTNSEVIGKPLESVWSEWCGRTESGSDGAKASEQLVTRQGDEQRVYDQRISSMIDWRGRLISRVIVLHDVTKRDRREQALREYSDRLAETLEQRTKELQDVQEELIRKERLAVLGQLVGGVSHELRNPLGVIANTVYYLKLALAEHLEAISSGVDNAEKIVSDLLNLSRTKPAEREQVAISELVAEVLEECAPPEDVQVTIEIPTGLASLFVDRRQIKQVLVNLVNNAYEAMLEGGQLDLRAREGQGWVYLSVADNGCGISEENKDKLFEPLFTTKATGVGLGLAVSKNLVEVNGGRIEVESKVGVGTTFTVKLPALHEQVTEAFAAEG